jgi:hypothetical protein
MANVSVVPSVFHLALFSTVSIVCPSVVPALFACPYEFVGASSMRVAPPPTPRRTRRLLRPARHGLTLPLPLPLASAPPVVPAFPPLSSMFVSILAGAGKEEASARVPLAPRKAAHLQVYEQQQLVAETRPWWTRIQTVTDAGRELLSFIGLTVCGRWGVGSRTPARRCGRRRGARRKRSARRPRAAKVGGGVRGKLSKLHQSWQESLTPDQSVQIPQRTYKTPQLALHTHQCNTRLIPPQNPASI